MQEFLLIAATIALSVVLPFVLLLWPLRAIIQSNKVAGKRKLGWVALWLAGLLMPQIVAGLVFERQGASGVSTFRAYDPAMWALSLLLVWTVYFWFRYRTRNLSPVSTGQALEDAVGYKLGRSIARVLRKLLFLSK